jgi:hypothetical protein
MTAENGGTPMSDWQTVREARIKAALDVLNGFDVSERSSRGLAEDVVDALFAPDPLIDNALVGPVVEGRQPAAGVLESAVRATDLWNAAQAGAQ